MRLRLCLCCPRTMFLGGIPWKVRFDMDFCILADLGCLAGLLGLLWPPAAGRGRALAKTGPQKYRFGIFLQLASKPSALEPQRDSVQGGGGRFEKLLYGCRNPSRWDKTGVQHWHSTSSFNLGTQHWYSALAFSIGIQHCSFNIGIQP